MKSERTKCVYVFSLFSFQSIETLAVSLTFIFVSWILHCEYRSMHVYCLSIVWSNSSNSQCVLQTQNGYININIFCVVLCVCFLNVFGQKKSKKKTTIRSGWLQQSLNKNTKANSTFINRNAIAWAKRRANASKQALREWKGKKMKCKTCETCAIKHTVHWTQCNFQTHFDKWITATYS